MKCPKCIVGNLYLTDSGGEPEYQEPQWVRCDNDEVESTGGECEFTDDNDEIKYEELQPWYGFNGDEIELLREDGGEQS